MKWSKILAKLRIRGWKCTCPKCFVTNYADNFNDAILAIKHKANCRYKYGGVRTMFNAVPIRMKYEKPSFQ